MLIPRFHGDFTIPPLEYSYFDPSSGKYKTVRTQEHSLRVLKTAGGEEATRVYGGVSKENVRYLGKDIRFINTSRPDFRLTENVLVINKVFLYSYPALIILFLLVVVLRREQIKRNSDIARVRNRKAAAVASKRLKKAENCLNGSDTEGFYNELLKALWGYLSDKFNIPLSELSISTVNEILSENKLDNEIIEELQDVISKCEYSKYSPASDISTADEIYGKAERIIRNIENKKYL